VVARLVAATLAYLREQGVPAGSSAPVGFDGRFLAGHFARLVYLALREGGMSPLLSAGPVPSPYLSFAVKKLKAPMGIMLTASHNPARYLGFKPKGPEGGSALPEVQKRIAELAESAPPAELNPGVVFGPPQDYEQFDLREAYATALADLLVCEQLDRSLKLVVDFMHGSAAPLYGQVLEHVSVGFTPSRSEPDPVFGGGKPEPVAPNMDELVGWVMASGKESIGAAFDGDGDRLGLVDESGEVVPNEDIFAICLLHLIEDRNQRGRIVKTVSFSSLIDRVAASFDLPIAEIPVGFKHATPELMVPDTLAAGEESGGMGFGFYLPERDALLALLLVLETLTMRGRGLSEMRRQLGDRFGRSYFVHRDVPLANRGQVQRIRQRMEEMASSPSEVGLPDATPERLDGLKLRHDRGFLLVRLSGTEPVLRLYCDDTTEGRERELVFRAQEFLLGGGPN